MDKLSELEEKIKKNPNSRIFILSLQNTKNSAGLKNLKNSVLPDLVIFLEIFRQGFF